MFVLAKKKSEKKKLGVPIRGIADNIIFSDKEVWAYYKVSTVPYEFLSQQAKAGLANNTVTALSSLCQNEGKKVDGHILITNTPFDVLSWADQMDTVYKNWAVDGNEKSKFTEPYMKFMDDQIEELIESSYQRPVVYLGLKLFNRGSFDFDSFNVFEFGFKDAFETFKRGVSAMWMLPGEEITDFDEKKARDKEEEIYRIISQGYLLGQRVSTEELLLTIKRQFYPSMPSPYLEVNYGERVGLSDIAIETGGVIENNYRSLKFTQIVDGHEYTGYRGTLSFARFPDSMSMPGMQVPFMYMPASMGLPFTMSSRFTMIPHQEMRKDLNKKKMETDDEIENLASSGQNAHAGIVGTVRDLSIMEENLENSKQPWLNGAYRLTIEAPTYEQLKDAVSNIKQAYSESDTTLVWTTGDQMDLFIEELPGSNLKIPSFNQKTNLSMLGVSGFNIGGTAGDPVQERLVTSKKVR